MRSSFSTGSFLDEGADSPIANGEGKPFGCWLPASLVLCVLALSACSPSQPQNEASAAHQQELDRLRAENAEVRRLQSENSELDRLRRENREMKQIQSQLGDIDRLTQENARFKQQIAQIQANRPAPVASAETPAPAEPQPLQPIVNLVQAFDEAAFSLANEPVKPEDLPEEGDLIEIDQSVIGLLIPDFATNPTGGKYEISGWLKSKGVTIKNYQQLNVLGLTNFNVRRVPLELRNNSAQP